MLQALGSMDPLVLVGVAALAAAVGLYVFKSVVGVALKILVAVGIVALALAAVQAAGIAIPVV